MKQFLGIIILGVFLYTGIAGTVPQKVQGYDLQYQEEAETLKALGLFRGTDQGFELEKTPTRIQGAVMLIRLLGKEKIALEKEYPHPFTDVPAWANAYVGYMYKSKLSNGTGPTTFSPDLELPAVQYITFVLRALGYSDSQGDFHWDKSLGKAAEIALLDIGTMNKLQNRTFLRDDMVGVSHMALSTNIKGKSHTLLQKLIEEDAAVPLAAAIANGLYPEISGKTDNCIWPEYSPGNPDDYQISTNIELEAAFLSAILGLQERFTLIFEQYPGDSKADLGPALKEVQAKISQYTGLDSLLKSWAYSGNRQQVAVELEYRYNNQELLHLHEKVLQVLSSTIYPEMSEYDKEKALHDYIIHNAQYDYENLINYSVPDVSYTAYGVLLLGRGVCQGYSAAMNVLCRGAGLDSIIVNGDAFSFGNWTAHCWNMVKIGGDYYHVDLTWDDPVSSDGQQKLQYNYFNLSDKDMQSNHSWEPSQYPACSASKYNYFTINGLLLDDYTAFKKEVKTAIGQEKDEILVRIARFNTEDYKNLNSLLFSGDTVRKYNFSIDNEQGIVHIFDLQYW